MPTRRRYWAIRKLHTEGAIEIFVEDFEHFVLSTLMGQFTIGQSRFTHDILALTSLLELRKGRVRADGKDLGDNIMGARKGRRRKGGNSRGRREATIRAIPISFRNGRKRGVKARHVPGAGTCVTEKDKAVWRGSEACHAEAICIAGELSHSLSSSPRNHRLHQATRARTRAKTTSLLSSPRNRRL